MIDAPDALRVDALANGFAADAPGAPWFHVRVGTHVTADARVRPMPGGGLHIAAPAANARTGHPAFSMSLAPESANGGIPAANDHPKWLAYINRQSSAGFPGFDAIPGTKLRGTARIAGRTFGTECHPFGAVVLDAHTDLRLAAFAVATIDVESWMVFDFLFTNRRVYALYERLPFGRTETNPYAAFSYAIPVRDRSEDDRHEATIAYDAAAGTTRWILDGAEVYRVTRIGHHLDSREHLLIDLGGVEQPQQPRQLAFGLGLFTMLDGAFGPGPGLVRLSDSATYYSPHGDRRPLSFVDENSRPESRLFGQGAEMSVAAFDVHRQRSVVADGAPVGPG